MAKKTRGLGRGLEALLPDAEEALSSGVQEISLGDIDPNPDQPRRSFSDESIAQLAQSIREQGVLQPILVTPQNGGRYRIVAGERRWRASRAAGLDKVPVIVRDLDVIQQMEIALIENLQREDLDPIEEAFGYQQLIENCGYTQEQAADRLGKSRTGVTNSLRLLKLEPAVRELVHTGTLSTGHAKVLLSLSGEEQCSAAQTVVKDGLTVRHTEQLIKKLKKPATAKPVKLSPALPGEVELALREVLGTEVRVTYKDGSGTLSIGFYSDEQLKDFANLLGKYKKEKGE